MSRPGRAPALLLISAALLGGCLDADRVANEIRATCALSAYPAVSGVSLPKLPGDAKPSEGFLLVVSPSEVTLDWRLIGEPAELDAAILGERLTELADRVRQIAEYTGKPPDLRLSVAVDRDQPLARLQTIAAAATQAGFAELQLLAEPAVAPPLPRAPDPELFARLRAVDPAERTMRVAMAIEDSITLCPAMTEVMGAIASAAPDHTCELLAAGAREAMGGLCLMDADAFLTAIIAASVPETPTTFHRVALDAPQLTPAQGATTPWGVALPRLAAAPQLGPGRPVTP